MLKKLKAKIQNHKHILGSRKTAVVFVAVIMCLTMLVATFAWYYKQVSLHGSTFKTGTIDFVAMGYDAGGTHITTLLHEGKNSADFANVNEPLFNHTEWEAGTTHTAYISIENTGSLSMEYKISFSAAGDVEYLGGFWYALTDITEEMPDVSDDVKLEQYIAGENNAKRTESEGYNMATMDRYATRGTIENDDELQKRYYRLDYGMRESAITTDYTNTAIEITPKIYVTQIGALSDEGFGYTYYCSNSEDIDKARDNALPGDSIRLMSNIDYEGDLVFNKPINIIANNYTLNVNGNIIYDYTSSKTLTVNVVGNGSVKVMSPAEGVGGNFTVNAPLGDVKFIGSNNSDIMLSGKFTVNATRAYGAAGASFSQVKIIDDETYADKTVYVSSDTRVTVLDNTTLTRVEAVEQANNIEIQNSGTITILALSNMYKVPQTTSPQIYISNMGYIVNPIELPAWSEKFTSTGSTPVVYSGNTRIVQTITGNAMQITCSGKYTSADIELESTGITVAPLGNNNAELVIYYQNTEDDGEVVETTIQSLLTEYFEEKGSAAPSVEIAKIRRLDIVSIGDKSVTNGDIEYINSTALNDLEYLDMSRAAVRDTDMDIQDRLCNYAFENVKKLKTLVLPQNLVEIGDGAMSGMDCPNIITIPGSVMLFGQDWFSGNNYVAFASATPVTTAVYGITDVDVIFVEEYYMESYKKIYSGFADKIFPMAVKDDLGQLFVRQLAGSNDWEIVYYIGTDASTVKIGDGVYVDKNLVNIRSVGASAYVAGIGDNPTEIEFSNTIKTIGDSAFKGTNITNVSSWGISLESIGASAFEGCTMLDGNIILPDSLKVIENSAFKGCSKMDRINTGGAETVKDNAFSGCTQLLVAELPNVTIITQTTGGTSAGVFYNNTNLVSVKLPSLVKTEGIVFNAGKTTNNTLAEVIFGSTVFEEVPVNANTTFYGTFGRLKIYFDMTDVSEVGSVSAYNKNIYPMGEKMGEVLVNGYNLGEYIVSDKISGDGTVTLITTNNASFSGDVVLPGEWNGKPITRIYDGAFRNISSRSNFTITMPDSIAYIGDYAFDSLTGLRGVTKWSEGLVEIGKYAFYKTGLADRVELPDNVLRRIDSSAFESCASITYVNTGSATELGIRVFYQCTKLVEAELPKVESVGDGRTSVNNDLFYGCKLLVSAKLLSMKSAQSTRMFYNCESLREIYMETSEPNLGGSAFNGVTIKNLRMYVPESVITIYKEKSLGGIDSVDFAKLVFPAGGVKAGEFLVNGFNIGEYIILPDSTDSATIVTSNLSFSGDVVFPDTMTAYDTGKEYKITKIYDGAFRNNTFNSVSLTMGSNVTEIGVSAFRDVSIISLDLKNTTIIGNYAFRNCSKLLTLSADKLESVGTYAFAGCSVLTTVNLPELKSTANYTFDNCINLTTVTLPKVTSIGQYTFYRCSALISVYLEDVTSFGSSSFSSCTKLNEVIINRVITPDDKVPTGASYVPKTIYVRVPYVSTTYYDADKNWKDHNVVSFDKVFTDADENKYILKVDGTECSVNMFFGNGNATTIVIPATMAVDGTTYTVAGLEYGAFDSAASTLTEITLPAGLYKFGSKALSEAAALTTIVVDSANRFYASDASGVMYNKDGGMLVKYPCGKADEAYVINNSVVAVGEYAFHGAQHLKNVTVGENVAVIDSTAFLDLVLASVTFSGAEPPLLMGSQIFDTSETGFTVIVPDGMSEAYIRSMNFATYAPYMKEASAATTGIGIPAEGAMNTIPQTFGSGSVAEYAALPPEMPEMAMFKEESDPDADPNPKPKHSAQ